MNYVHKHKIYSRLTAEVFFKFDMIMAYSEVIRIHVEFFAVQAAQRSINALDVVHVLHRLVKRLQHHPAMSCHFGVIQDSSCSEDIPKGTEVSLGPGVDNQHPVSVRDWLFLV